MSEWALLLVIPAAITHAIWNYLTKKAGGVSLFIGIVAAVSSVIYLPVAVWAAVKDGVVLSWPQLGWLAVSGLWHMIYFCLLERGTVAGTCRWCIRLPGGLACFWRLSAPSVSWANTQVRRLLAGYV